MSKAAAPSDASRAVEPAIAVRLALLLDGRRTGLTFDEIVASGTLSIDDNDESEDTLRKRFERARERLGRVGIVVSGTNVADETRYVVNAGLSYSAEQSITLDGEQALQLASLLAICRQADLPFRDDLERARTRLASMVRVDGGDSPETEMAGHKATTTHKALRHPAGSPESRKGPSPSPRQAHDTARPPVPVERPAEPALDVVTDAYTQARPLVFSYVNARGVASQRTVSVYGLFKHRAHTYFVGLDEASGQIRVFRVGRITARPAPQIDRSSTYTVPADFDVRDYRHLPFQYGDEPFVAAFRDTRGLSEQQRATVTQGLGTWEDCDGQDPLWRVDARDRDEAASWAALALATDGLLPLEPPELVAAVRAGLERTVKLHG